MEQNPAALMERARILLREAKSVVVLTGAGISAESGVPTFRGAGGLWKQFRAEDLATPEAFRRDPQLCWEWYDWRRGLLAEAQPNAGHYALAELERRVQKFTLITQNVDGLHAEAGSTTVLEIHGSIWTLRCTACGREWLDRAVPLALLPRCAICNALARPGVVWFGENLNPKIWADAEEAASSSDVFLVVGTSAVVYPAAGLTPRARSAGAKVIEVNIEQTPMSALVDCALTGRAGEILPAIIGSVMNKARAIEGQSDAPA
jgi:NAD-dependent deacetylase